MRDLFYLLSFFLFALIGVLSLYHAPDAVLFSLFGFGDAALVVGMLCE